MASEHESQPPRVDAAIDEPVAPRKRDVKVTSATSSLLAEVEARGHSWTLDADSAAGADPVTAFLGALGGCLLMSLRIAARVRGIDLGAAAVRARANEKGHLKEIKVMLEVESALASDRLARLVEVAERGCHIRAMLSDDIAFDLSVTQTARNRFSEEGNS